MKQPRFPHQTTLQYLLNPLIENGGKIPLDSRSKVKRLFKKCVDPTTGEIVNGDYAQFEKKIVDTEFYYKGFAKCMDEVLDLGAAGQRVFAYVMRVYIETPMAQSYCDFVSLIKTGPNEINGALLPFHAKTLERGLTQLLKKRFLEKRSPGQYWINPHLFFRGNRADLVKDYNAKLDRLQKDPRFNSFLEEETEQETSESLPDCSLAQPAQTGMQQLLGPAADSQPELGFDRENSQ